MDLQFSDAASVAQIEIPDDYYNSSLSFRNGNTMELLGETGISGRISFCNNGADNSGSDSDNSDTPGKNKPDISWRNGNSMEFMQDILDMDLPDVETAVKNAADDDTRINNVRETVMKSKRRSVDESTTSGSNSSLFESFRSTELQEIIERTKRTSLNELKKKSSNGIQAESFRNLNDAIATAMENSLSDLDMSNTSRGGGGGRKYVRPRNVRLEDRNLDINDDGDDMGVRARQDLMGGRILRQSSWKKYGCTSEQSYRDLKAAMQASLEDVADTDRQQSNPSRNGEQRKKSVLDEMLGEGSCVEKQKPIRKNSKQTLQLLAMNASVADIVFEDDMNKSMQLDGMVEHVSVCNNIDDDRKPAAAAARRRESWVEHGCSSADSYRDLEEVLRASMVVDEALVEGWLAEDGSGRDGLGPPSAAAAATPAPTHKDGSSSASNDLSDNRATFEKKSDWAEYECNSEQFDRDLKLAMEASIADVNVDVQQKQATHVEKRGNRNNVANDMIDEGTAESSSDRQKLIHIDTAGQTAEHISDRKNIYEKYGCSSHKSYRQSQISMVSSTEDLDAKIAQRLQAKGEASASYNKTRRSSRKKARDRKLRAESSSSYPAIPTYEEQEQDLARALYASMDNDDAALQQAISLSQANAGMNDDYALMQAMSISQADSQANGGMTDDEALRQAIAMSQAIIDAEVRDANAGHESDTLEFDSKPVYDAPVSDAPIHSAIVREDGIHVPTVDAQASGAVANISKAKGRLAKFFGKKAAEKLVEPPSDSEKEEKRSMFLGKKSAEKLVEPLSDSERDDKIWDPLMMDNPAADATAKKDKKKKAKDELRSSRRSKSRSKSRGGERLRSSRRSTSRDEKGLRSGRRRKSIKQNKVDSSQDAASGLDYSEELAEKAQLSGTSTLQAEPILMMDQLKNARKDRKKNRKELRSSLRKAREKSTKDLPKTDSVSTSEKVTIDNTALTSQAEKKLSLDERILQKKISSSNHLGAPDLSDNFDNLTLDEKIARKSKDDEKRRSRKPRSKSMLSSSLKLLAYSSETEVTINKSKKKNDRSHSAPGLDGYNSEPQEAAPKRYSDPDISDEIARIRNQGNGMLDDPLMMIDSLMDNAKKKGEKGNLSRRKRLSVFGF